ncbi:putative C globular stage [Heracleum sosnowskyi]|uniref:C globular stage n=1 Tax=Heracleum sosnowskyi TaxID=360622 RepID=A0AAD8MK40_9APIA|nr:putative C globular stage [Heracleum sosnowskyi]
MEDHQSDADSLVEEKEELMVPPCGGNPVYRKAHFLKPILPQDHLHLPPSPTALLASKPTFRKLENCTLQSFKGCPSEKWSFWVQSLKPKYQEIWKKAGIYEAILASTYSVPKHKKLIICLAERWCVDTNTFVFPWGEVTITLEDVIHLGCFSVLGASFLNPLDDECNDIFNCLKSDLKKVKLGNYQNATPYAWMDYFMSSGNQLEHEAFLACWLSKFVHVRTNIAIQDCHVAIPLSRGHRIALAPVVLACIYRDMTMLHNSIVKTVIVESRFRMKFSTCHYDLVQMWVWERFTGFGPVPNVIGSGEPRSARWNGVTKSKVNDVRTALDSAGLSFMWRPYTLGSSNNILSTLYKDIEQWVVVESDAEESYARCLRASELVGLWQTEQYLPHRVAMQFGLDQDLPCDVVRFNESPPIAWENYNEPIRGLKLYIPHRLSESDVSSRYVAWWRGLVPMNEQMVTNSVQNEKHLPLGSYRQIIDAIPLATTASLSCNLEETPEIYVAENGCTNVQHMSQFRNTDRSGKRNDLDDGPILNSYDDVEEDNMTIAQLLKQSGKGNSFERSREADNKQVLNNVTPSLLAICHEAPEKSNYTSNNVDNFVQIMFSSDKCEKSKSSTQEQTEKKRDAVVSRNLKFTNELAELSVHNTPTSDKHKESQFSTERPTEQQEDAGGNPEDNLNNIEEESHEETASELQHLGLKTRIWRLERIVDMIRAAKIAGTTGGNQEK